MWGWEYLALFAFGTLWTYVWAVRKETTFFTALLAGITWLYLAIGRGDLTVVDGGQSVAIAQAGGVQWFAFGLTAISLAAALGSLLGIYPPEETEDDEDEPAEEVFEIPT